MADYTVIEDWQAVEGRYVLDVTIQKTDDRKYPSGWDYSLHLGTLDGETMLRYDNAHERRVTNAMDLTGSNTSSFRGCYDATTSSSGRSTN